MKSTIKKIDRALKDLNQLETPQRAENFLLDRSPFHPEKGSHSENEFQGALLVRSTGKNTVSLGIYFNQNLSKRLETIQTWDPKTWSHEEVKAIAIATEEISHFHYLLSNAEIGKPVTQLELELQAEIDKFMLFFFSLSSESGQTAKHFELLFEMFFYQFHLKENLKEEEKARYQEANNIAKSFIIKCRKLLEEKQYGDALKLLRQFYRLTTEEKVSLANRK